MGRTPNTGEEQKIVVQCHRAQGMGEQESQRNVGGDMETYTPSSIEIAQGFAHSRRYGKLKTLSRRAVLEMKFFCAECRETCSALDYCPATRVIELSPCGHFRSL